MTPRRIRIGLVFCLAALTMLMACAGVQPSPPSPVVEAPPPPPTYFVNISGLALRNGPSTSSPQISTLEFNDEVRLMSTNDGWGRVLDVRRNITGWASLRYLQPSPASRPHYVPRRSRPAAKPSEPAIPEPPETPPSKPSETPVPRVM